MLCYAMAASVVLSLHQILPVESIKLISFTTASAREKGIIKFTKVLSEEKNQETFKCLPTHVRL